MGIREDSKHELARKAMWAEVYDHAANLFKDLADDTQEDPVERYNAIFISAYLFSMLGDKENSLSFESRFKKLNDEVSKYSLSATNTRRRFPQVKERVKYLTDSLGSRMTDAEVISYFVSPHYYETILRKLLKTGAKPPFTSHAGIFRYSVTGRLESVVVRGYSERGLDMNRLSEGKLRVMSKTELGVMLSFPNEFGEGVFIIDKLGVFTADFPFIKVADRELLMIRQNVAELSRILS